MRRMENKVLNMGREAVTLLFLFFHTKKWYAGNDYLAKGFI